MDVLHKIGIFRGIRKHYRAIAPGYDKLAQTFLRAIAITASLLWLIG